MRKMRYKMKNCAEMRKEKRLQPVTGEIEVERVKRKEKSYNKKRREIPEGWRCGEQTCPVQVKEPSPGRQRCGSSKAPVI